MSSLTENLFLFQEKGLSPFLSRWRKGDILLDQPVEIVTELSKAKAIES